jgi:hypothetical protein
VFGNDSAVEADDDRSSRRDAPGDRIVDEPEELGARVESGTFGVPGAALVRDKAADFRVRITHMEKIIPPLPNCDIFDHTEFRTAPTT